MVTCAQRVSHSVLLGALQNSGTEAWYPFLNLSSPIVQCRFRDDDKMRTGGALLEFEVSEE